MLLSSEIIYHYLKEHFEFEVQGQLNYELFYGRPMFWDASEQEENRKIYLCQAEKIPESWKTSVHSLVLAVGKISEAAEKFCDAMFLFAEDVSLLKLSNILNRLFDAYDSWDQELTGLLANQSPIGRFLDCSEKIFNNPVIVHNQDFEFIAHSRSIDTHPSLGFLIDKSQSVDAYSSFRLDQGFRATFASREAEFFPDTITGIRSVYINIFNHGTFIGRIVIPEVIRPFQVSDKALLTHFSQFIQATVIRQPDDYEGNLNTLDNLVYLMLTEQVTDDAYIEKAMSTFRWQKYHDYFCSVFSMDPLDVQNYTFKMIRNKLEAMVPNSCVVEYQQELVMFVNLSLGPKRQSEIVRLYTELVRDSFLKVGYSKVYKGFHFSFGLLHQQAKTALNYGGRYLPEIWIHSFNSIADKYLLERLTGQFPAEMVCAPEIVEMYRYDEIHHTEYFYTLKCYLENNMQPVATAKELFIHRTTLIYRLNKIEELFAPDISTAHNRLFFHLSIVLLEQTLLNGEQEV